jgi:hypothetical protein
VEELKNEQTLILLKPLKIKSETARVNFRTSILSAIVDNNFIVSEITTNSVYYHKGPFSGVVKPQIITNEKLNADQVAFINNILTSDGKTPQVEGDFECYIVYGENAINKVKEIAESVYKEGAGKTFLGHPKLEEYLYCSENEEMIDEEINLFFTDKQIAQFENQKLQLKEEKIAQKSLENQANLEKLLHLKQKLEEDDISGLIKEELENRDVKQEHYNLVSEVLQEVEAPKSQTEKKEPKSEIEERALQTVEVEKYVKPTENNNHLGDLINGKKITIIEEDVELYYPNIFDNEVDTLTEDEKQKQMADLEKQILDDLKSKDEKEKAEKKPKKATKPKINKNANVTRVTEKNKEEVTAKKKAIDRKAKEEKVAKREKELKSKSSTKDGSKKNNKNKIDLKPEDIELA